MSNYETSDYKVDLPLNLRTPAGAWLALPVEHVRLGQRDEKIVSCLVTFRAGPDLYAQIDQQALLHLEPEARGPLFGGAFDPAGEVEIEARLAEEMLPYLNEGTGDADEAVSKLFELSQARTDHPLLSTGSWYGLEVKQEVPLPPELAEIGTLKAGYRTVWAKEDPTEEDEAEALEIGPLQTTLLNFFTENEWPIISYGEQTVNVGFAGDHGEWECYAVAREEQEQALFYSLCPLAVPEHKRAALAEFLTRANWGLPVGNFEMNWQTGAIHFKTSIDVEGDRLNEALFGQIVYANVTAMDHYLPGIEAIIKKEVSPVEAIARLEG
ncbi:MAG: YbjN domain-containing protein [Anaerolineales bacterium]|nr:YbjN domain-containing protein [Anaerolineales bacterium]